MKRFLLTISSFIKRAALFLGLFILPLASQAAEETASSQKVTFKNPLATTDIFEFVGTYIIGKAMLGVVGSIGLLMMLIGGIMWLTSGGNPERIKKAEQLILWAILGLVVIFASYTIVAAIISAIPTAK